MEYIHTYFGSPMPTAAVQAFMALRPGVGGTAAPTDAPQPMFQAATYIRGLNENEAHWILLSGHPVAATLRRVWCELCENPHGAALSDTFSRGIRLLRGLRLHQNHIPALEALNTPEAHELFQSDGFAFEVETATACTLSLADDERAWIFGSDDRLAAYARQALGNVYTSNEGTHSLRQFARAVAYMREFGAHKTSAMAPATSMMAGAKLTSRASSRSAAVLARSFSRIPASRSSLHTWPDLYVWVTDADHTIATWRNMLIAVWKGARTLENFPEEGGPLLARLRGEYGDNIVILAIPEAASSVPNLQAVRRFVTLMKRYRHSARAAAMVIEKPGAMGDVVRRLSQSMAKVLLRGVPTDYFADIPQAMHWVATELARKNHQFDELAAGAAISHLRGPPAATLPSPTTSPSSPSPGGPCPAGSY